MKKILLLFIVLFSGFIINTSSVYAAHGSGGSNTVYDSNGKEVKVSVTTGEKSLSSNCDSLFGSPTNPNDFAYYLQIIFDVMKFAGIIIAVIMTILDLTKMISEQKDLDYASFGKKTLKRILYAVLIFVLPNLLTYLFNIIGLYGTCGIN